ncbi:MAG: tetratricopeptide repeat protein, partial [Chitinivibrionales bacterium]|nr:tetratricopeptide repeat protein [Chitinivibrionales bacterium]
MQCVLLESGASIPKQRVMQQMPPVRFVCAVVCALLRPDTASTQPLTASIRTPYQVREWQVHVARAIERGRHDSAQAIAQSSLEYFPRNPALCAAYADLFWRAERFELALPWVERLHELQGTDATKKALATARRNVGVLQSEKGAWEDAAASFERSLSLNPTDSSLYAAVAHAHIRAGNFEAGARRARQGMAHGGDAATLVRLRAYALGQLRRFDEAQKALDTYVEKHPDDVAVRLELNRLRQARGQVEPALRDLTDLLDIHPEDPRIYRALAAVQQRSGALADERRTCLAMLERFPRADSLHLRIARSYEREGRSSEARSHYRRYLDGHPDNVTVALHIAESFADDHLLDSALRSYDRIIGRWPHLTDAYRRAGSLHEEAGIPHKALAHYRDWARKASALPEPHVALAGVFHGLGKADSALAHYRIAEERGGNAESALALRDYHRDHQTTDSLRLYQARALERLVRETARAERHLDASTAPHDMSHERIAALELRTQAHKLQRSRESLWDLVDTWYPQSADSSLQVQLEHLLRTYPNAPLILHALARMHVARRNDSAAAETYRRYLSLSPRSVDALLGLASVRERLGDTDRALLLCRRAMESAPGHDDIYGPTIRLARRNGALEQLARRMEQLLAAGDDQPVLRRHL